MTARKVNIWQCRDWCCEAKPHAKKWWHVGITYGNYDSVPTWPDALEAARIEILRRAA